MGKCKVNITKTVSQQFTDFGLQLLEKRELKNRVLKKQESYFSDACSPAFNGAKKQNKTKNKAKAKKDNAPDLELWTAHRAI